MALLEDPNEIVLLLACLAVIWYVMGSLPILGPFPISLPSFSGGDDEVYKTYEGCRRYCCKNPDGTDCRGTTKPCNVRSDGRSCFKRFQGGVDGCPNPSELRGVVAPPADYVSESCYAQA
jgi:hypothetical protein